jgi:predicted hydrocarbon binding protein
MTNGMKYHFDLEKGVIYDEVTGDRCFIMTKARLLQIISRLTDLFQSGAQVIIAEAFKAAGERYATEVPEEARVDQAMFLKTAVQRFTDGGLGKIEVVKFKPEKLELTFRIWNNLFAEMHNEESTYCNCVAAFASGMYKRITQKTPEITETKCSGKGDAYCEWHVKLAE